MTHRLTPFTTIDDLHQFTPKYDFLIAIDSDGTIFDSMEIKHKDCFIGTLIRHFGLAAITHEVHEVWNYVNIFSINRGTNRFKALVLCFDYLNKIERISVQNITLPDLKFLRQYLDKYDALSNESIKLIITDADGIKKDEFQSLLDWSEDVNKTVEKTVFNLPPMLGAIKTLKKLQNRADLVVVSNTPLDTLHREWNDNNLSQYIRSIGGQETGNKTEMLTALSTKYPSEHILVIGDSPGDLKAAKNAQTLFFPVLPMKEEKSWKLFLNEGMGRFFNHQFKGKFEDKCITDFHNVLQTEPSW